MSRRFSSKRWRSSIGGTPLLIAASNISPTGKPAISLPPVMQSIIAYSSATRTGSRALPSERPTG